MSAYDRWQAAEKAAEDGAGYTAARAVWIAAADRYEAFRLRLIHMQTTDPGVMAVKAAVVAERYDSDDGVVWLGHAIRNHLKNEDDLEALCFSIVRDFALRFGSAV